MSKKIIILVFLFVFFVGKSQEIRTIQLKPVGSSEQLNIVPLGSVLELSFDDLDADNKEYQYKIEHQTFDWKPSNLVASQYIDGFQQNYITDITNSFNTLQTYTHYSLTIPNENLMITKTGNYLISILDENENIVFSRRCVFYENNTLVGVSVTPARISQSLNQEQNVQVIVNYKNFRINNPQQEIKVAIMQNNNWKSTRYNTIPQYFKPQQLIYSYLNKNNFKGGNEFRHFDSKSIRNTSMNIVKTEMKDLHHNYLYTDEPRRNIPYSYNPDTNGQFVIRTLDGDDPNTESDYAIMHFSLEDFEQENKDIYIVGMFNNYTLSNENKMTYENGIYFADIKLKQGFYDYKYVVLDEENRVNNILIDGSFYQTDNEYTVLIYYHPLGSLYDQVIGVGRGYVKN